MSWVTTLFGDYEPDKPPNNDMGNAYVGAGCWRPVGAFQAITAALPGPFNGATAFVATDGTSALLGGTTDAIYRYSGSAWSDIATGLTVPDRWQFTQFGDLAIAVNGGVTKKIDLIASSIADIPDAPTAVCVATVRDFVVYGQANGDKAMVQWSGFNNQDDNTPGVNQAGFQPMLAGGFVMGITSGEYGLIIQRSRVVRMTYTTDPDDPFQFDPISENIGAISRGSIVQAGNIAFFYSDKGFMKCDGNEVTPIGVERVDKTFADLYPRSILDQMYAAVYPRRNVVAWMMPGTPGLMLLYDYALDKWAPIRTNAIAVFSGFTANISLEDLDALYPDGLDSMPYSLDDPRFSGGDPVFLLVDQNYVFGTLTGDNMAAFFACQLQEYVSGRRARVKTSRVIGDAISGVTITLDSRRMLGNAASTVTTGDIQPSGTMPVRANARFIAPRLDFAAGATWSFQQGLQLDVEDGGGR